MQRIADYDPNAALLHRCTMHSHALANTKYPKNKEKYDNHVGINQALTYFQDMFNTGNMASISTEILEFLDRYDDELFRLVICIPSTPSLALLFAKIRVESLIQENKNLIEKYATKVGRYRAIISMANRNIEHYKYAMQPITIHDFPMELLEYLGQYLPPIARQTCRMLYQLVPLSVIYLHKPRCLPIFSANLPTYRAPLRIIVTESNADTALAINKLAQNRPLTLQLRSALPETGNMVSPMYLQLTNRFTNALSGISHFNITELTFDFHCHIIQFSQLGVTKLRRLNSPSSIIIERPIVPCLLRTIEPVIMSAITFALMLTCMVYFDQPIIIPDLTMSTYKMCVPMLREYMAQYTTITANSSMVIYNPIGRQPKTNKIVFRNLDPAVHC